MRLQQYDGKWVECSARNPEQLVILAPQHLQEQCIRTGGLNLYGRPRFRLVWTPSRFFLSGSHDVQIPDENGTIISTAPQQAFLPRYEIDPTIHDCYVLERWRPAEWYAKQGFGGENSYVGHAFGKRIQQLEPIWPQGGYEAVLRDIEDPWVFPKTITTWTLYKAIRLTLINDSITDYERALHKRNERERTKEELHIRRVDQIRHRMGPFGFKSFSAYGQMTRKG